MSIVVRTTVDPNSLASAIRQTVFEVDKTVPVEDFETMERLVTESAMQPRFNMVLLSLFGGIALLLSAAGFTASPLTPLANALTNLESVSRLVPSSATS